MKFACSIKVRSQKVSLLTTTISARRIRTKRRLAMLFFPIKRFHYHYYHWDFLSVKWSISITDNLFKGHFNLGYPKYSLFSLNLSKCNVYFWNKNFKFSMVSILIIRLHWKGWTDTVDHCWPWHLLQFYSYVACLFETPTFLQHFYR